MSNVLWLGGTCLGKVRSKDRALRGSTWSFVRVLCVFAGVSLLVAVYRAPSNIRECFILQTSPNPKP